MIIESLKKQLAEANVLILGLGGGCDVITSIALAEMLSLSKVRIGNTKSGRNSMKRLNSVGGTSFAFTTPASLPRPNHKRWKYPVLEECLPRVNEEPFLLFQCLKTPEALNQLATDFQAVVSSLDISHILAVDTGGDVLCESSASGPMGRDRRMLEAVKKSGLPVTLFVVGPGSDGESTESELQAALQAHQANFLGEVSNQPMVAKLAELGEWVGKDRTPNIIVKAHSTTSPQSPIKRKRKPDIPTAWLQQIWIFDS